MKRIISSISAALVATTMIAAPAMAGDKGAAKHAPGHVKKMERQKSAKQQAPGQKMKNGQVDSAREAAPGQVKKDDMQTASIDLSAEQRTRLRTVFDEVEVRPADVTVDFAVGTAVPSTVVLAPLPPRVIEVVPTYSGYEYFTLADGRIIIVEPSTMHVVYILS